jgi:hypothetical protein
VKKACILFICTLFSISVFSQKITKEKSPKKAAIYSAIIPGVGQVYTKKYWKVPIIYSGLVTSAYFINSNNKQYKTYKTAAITSVNNNSTDQIVNGRNYSFSELKTLKDHYRRNRELSYFSFITVYLLNVVDASVNAHLYHFDISDDISLNIQPYLNLNNQGINLSINF